MNCLCLAILGSLVSADAADIPEIRVLVDGSGSMRGYARSGALGALVGDIEATAREEGWEVATQVFHTPSGYVDGPQWTAWSIWNSTTGQPQWGDVTELDRAVEAATPGAHALVLVTDNFQDDAGAGPGGDTERFYARLRDSSIERAYLIPDLLAFDGMVDIALEPGLPTGAAAHASSDVAESIRTTTNAAFVESGGIGAPLWRGAGSTGFWKVPYKGRRGLAIYALLYDAALREDFDGFVHDVSQARGDLTPLLIRPLGADSLALQPPTLLQSDSVALGCDSQQRSAPPTPNLDIVAVEGDHGSSYSLERRADFAYDPRKPSRFTAALEIVSSEAHVRIGSGGASCANAATIEVGLLKVKVPPSLSGILLPATSAGTATPRTLMGSLDRREKRPRAIFVTLDVPALVGPSVPSATLKDQLSAAFELVVHVPRDAMGLTPAVADRYFTRTALDLARIYSPVDIVRYLAPESVEIRVPVEIRSDVLAPTETSAEADLRGWAWFVAGVAPLLAAWIILRPFGFTAPIRHTSSPRAHSVRVGGLLRRCDTEINIGGTDTLLIGRPVWWKRVLAAREPTTGGVVARFAEGDRVPVAGRGGEIAWLTGIEAKRLHEEGLYEP